MRLIDANTLRKKAQWMEMPDNQGINFDVRAVSVSSIDLAPTIEAEPVVHAKWVDRYGGKYANQLYECSECKGKALYKIEVDVLGKENLVQALSAACPHCRAKMDKEADHAGTGTV